jgi:hypothetical protein
LAADYALRLVAGIGRYRHGPESLSREEAIFQAALEHDAAGERAAAATVAADAIARNSEESCCELLPRLFYRRIV